MEHNLVSYIHKKLLLDQNKFKYDLYIRLLFSSNVNTSCNSIGKGRDLGQEKAEYT